MSLAPLDYLLDIAGLARARPGEVAITGQDPVLPTRFRVGAAGAAAIGACALAAGRLWALRSGSKSYQTIGVDVRHATAALRSTRYLFIDGVRAHDLREPLTRLYRAREGRWVFLHCNFLNHRVAALGVLGLPPDADAAAVARAVGDRDASALEDMVHGAGGCAGLARTPEEWARHPQAAAVAGLPLLAIERIGDAPREPLGHGERPLSGVRVLDLTRVLAGPTCARTLAEHGADVLKVSGRHLPHSGDAEIDTGLGKLSTFLDLSQPSGHEVLLGLIGDGRCDVFSQSYRPGTLTQRGLGAETLASVRPGIVYVELSAWGAAGPWAARRGFDTVVQCASGMATLQGGDKGPRIMPVSAIDYVSGYLMAFGATVALERRAREGGSWRVRVSLARTARWIVELGLLDPAMIADVAAELPEEEIVRICLEASSPLGRIRHLAPVAHMSVTPPQWSRPPVSLGSSPPTWPARPGRAN